jgi:hypothetical protein
METLLFDCLNCKARVEHKPSDPFGTLPQGLVFVQCVSCDVFSVKQLRNAKSHKEAGISRCSCGSWVIEGVACLICAGLDTPIDWEKR